MLLLKDRIKIIREKTHLTQKQLADLLEISKDRVKNIENGRVKKLLPEEVKILENEFNINSNWLLKGEGDMYNSNTIHQTNINHGNQGVGNIGNNLDKINNTFSNTDDPELEIICKYVKKLNEENRTKVLKFVLDLKN